MNSKHLDSRRLRAIDRIGDVLIPGDAELARFSKSGCVSQVDRILDFMPAQDLADLKTLLLLLSFFPYFLLKLFLSLLERSENVPGELGSVLRLIRLGLRGLIMTLYFSDHGVLKQVGYQVSVYTGDRGLGTSE